MAFNPDVTGTVLRTFVSVVSRWLRRRARAVGIRGLLKTGGVRRCALADGFSLHANVRIAANDRDGLEHVARYLARPPIAADRLTALPDGKVALRLKRRWSEGTEALVFTPAELIAKLLPLVPRPRKHVIRFHGVLAPAAAARSGIVPQAKAAEPSKPTVPPGTAYRLPWANLLRRVFLVDALDCPRCHGRMRIVAGDGGDAR